MTQDICERESLVVTAVRSGAWPAELEQHASACAACTETKRVAQLFLEHAADSSARSQPLPANILWRKLQAQRQQLAIRRATRCMTLLRILAAVYALVLAAWYLPQLWHTQLTTDLSALSRGVVVAGVLTAISAVFIGSCCLVLLGSRTTFRLRS
jgi:hypothetical protein